MSRKPADRRATKVPGAEPRRPAEAGTRPGPAAGFAQGEPQAVARVRARVRRILSFRGLRIPVEDRRDIEQTVMTQLWQSASRQVPQDNRFWGLVELVSARRCIDWRRQRREPLELSERLEDRDPGPLDRSLSRERSELADAALAELGADCRELIRLRAREGKSYREIAALTGRSEGALRVRLHRCVRRAQELLQERMGS